MAGQTAGEVRIDVPPPELDDRFRQGSLTEQDLKFLRRYRSVPAVEAKRRREERKGIVLVVSTIVAFAGVFAYTSWTAGRDGAAVTHYVYGLEPTTGPYASSLSESVCDGGSGTNGAAPNYVCSVVVADAQASGVGVWYNISVTNSSFEWDGGFIPAITEQVLTPGGYNVYILETKAVVGGGTVISDVSVEAYG